MQIEGDKGGRKKEIRQKSSKTDDLRCRTRLARFSGGRFTAGGVRVAAGNGFQAAWVNNCYIGDGCLITFSFTLWKIA